MLKIELTDIEKHLVIENAHLTSALLTTIVATIINRLNRNDEAVWAHAHNQVQEIGPSISSLQRCEISPVAWQGLDYVRDMLAQLKLPERMRDFLNVCKVESVIDLKLGDADKHRQTALDAQFKAFSIKTGITITLISEVT